MRAGEPVPAAEKTVVSDTGLSPGAKAADHERAAEAAEEQKNESERLDGQAEHLLPRRHGLIQSFPKGLNMSLLLPLNRARRL